MAQLECTGPYRGLRAVLLLLTLVAVSSSLECYSCVSVAGAEGQASCNEPWRSWRDTFNALTGPPKRPCQDACVKIVIRNTEGANSVVRTCGEMCNETLAGNTLTSCCQEDLCNGAQGRTFTTSRTFILWYTAISAILIYLPLFLWS